MPHHDMDPAASTDKFRAFVDDDEARTPRRARPETGGKGIAAAVVAGVVGVAVLIVLALLLM